MEPVLAVDIGGTSTKLGLLTGPEELRFLESIATMGPAEAFVVALSARMAQVVRETGATRIGMAVAGFLTEDCDRLLYNSNLPWLEGYPLKHVVEQRCGLPAALDSDSNTAALAEYYLGTGRGSRRFLVLTIGTGLGVGMIVNGEPMRFAYGCMGDAGHVIVEPLGALCPCGGRGCAEGLLSAPALAERWRVASERAEPATLRDVIEAGRSGDAAAARVLTKAGEWLGLATASLANIFFPDRIAFAGGLAEARELVLAETERVFFSSASIFARERVTLARAELGSMATLHGAGFTALPAAELAAIV